MKKKSVESYFFEFGGNYTNAVIHVVHNTILYIRAIAFLYVTFL